MEAKLNATRMVEAEYVRRVWAVTVADGTDVKQLEIPEYWSQVAHKLKPRDLLVVGPDDGAWFAEFQVRSRDRTWAHVSLLRYVKFAVPEMEPETLLTHKVQWRGPHSKHAVVRLSDKAVLQDGFDTAELAHQWLSNHKRGLDGRAAA